LKKESQRLNEIRTFLLEKEKVTWTEISNATRIQPKELSGDLKYLLGRKEIMCEQDTEDRRKTWYILNDKKTTCAEIKLYEAKGIIVSMEDTENFEKFIKEFEVNVEIMTTDSMDEIITKKAKKREISLEEFLEAMNKPKYFSAEEMFTKANEIEIIISFRRREKL
jgi:hypothetical protein